MSDLQFNEPTNPRSHRALSGSERSAAIIHEVRNIVSCMQAVTHQLRQRIKTAGSMKLQDACEKHFEDLNDIHAILREKLQDVQKVNLDNKSLRKRYCSVDELIDDLLYQFTTICETRNIALKVVRPEFPILARINLGDVFIAVANLLLNAIKAIGENGQITLAITDPHRLLDIAVSDSAAKLTGRELESIINQQAGGRGGMGLVLTRRVARDHFGDLYLDANTGKTTFTFRIPRLMR